MNPRADEYRKATIRQLPHGAVKHFKWAIAAQERNTTMAMRRVNLRAIKQADKWLRPFDAPACFFEDTNGATYQHITRAEMRLNKTTRIVVEHLLDLYEVETLINEAWNAINRVARSNGIERRFAPFSVTSRCSRSAGRYENDGRRNSDKGVRTNLRVAV